MGRPIHRCDFICRTPQSISIVNDENKQIYVDIPGEGSAISLKDIYLELEFDVKHEAAGNNL